MHIFIYPYISLYIHIIKSFQNISKFTRDIYNTMVLELCITNQYIQDGYRIVYLENLDQVSSFL